MIQEAYVSYEVAKLLKEKGFVGENEIGCRCGFYKQNEEYPSQINLVYDDLNNSELEYNECLRFTHQMALKWLREVHDIHIEVGLQPHINEDMFEYYVKLFNPETSTWVLDAHVHNWDTYEEACEAAIKYCLKYLIL